MIRWIAWSCSVIAALASWTDETWAEGPQSALDTQATASLQITILSGETGKPVPAMVSLVRKTDGSDYRPGNAMDWVPQFDTRGKVTSLRPAGLPGLLKSHHWWCVPGPFEMPVPADDWEIIVRRGVEWVPIFDHFTTRTGQRLEKAYRLQRWVDMPKLGWYSGDDHVHCRLINDEDAKRLMAWVQAEDVHVANILKMGDIFQTWFEQRGFGKTHRVVDGDYVLAPGQECPRTHSVGLGHTISLNTKSMVRDTDKYFLYDWVANTVHQQGGLFGYAHVWQNTFNVQRGMSISVPLGYVDFSEILQCAQLGTDLYYELLNLGYKMTATAGSDVPYQGSIGEVLMYGFTGKGNFSADAWYDAVGHGHTFVTNGPMLEFNVDGALPGDEIKVAAPRKLRVHARVWGDPRRFVPTKLEVIRLGDVVKAATSSEAEKKELSLDFEVDSANGFWIAARAEGSDGSVAHTTPVYVIRPPLRFWKLASVESLIAKRLTNLDELEKLIADCERRTKEGRVGKDPTIERLAIQGPELRKRMNTVREIYGELKQTAVNERSLRTEK